MKNLLLIILVLAAVEIYAQKTIAVQDGSNVTFYTSFDEAVGAAPAGSTIYLPAGSYTAGTNAFSIAKELHIVGAGANTTNPAGRTIMYSTVRFISGSSNSSISGIYFEGTLETSGISSEGTLSGFVITRNYFAQNVNLSHSKMENFFISENVIKQGLFCGNGTTYRAKYFTLTKNVIGYLAYISLSDIDNNVFYNVNVDPFSSIIDNQIRNSIIISKTSTKFANSGNNTLYNCLFHDDITFPYGSNNAFNELTDIPTDNIFENVTSFTQFSYEYDYHLKTTCPGVNYGTDGTDVGIYGTDTPFKTNGAPANPSIIKSGISVSDSENKIRLDIEVEAQSR